MGEKKQSPALQICLHYSDFFLCSEGKRLFGGTNNSQTSETCQGTPTTSCFIVRGHKPKLIWLLLEQYFFKLIDDFRFMI